jgi:hypothetical protein
MSCKILPNGCKNDYKDRLEPETLPQERTRTKILLCTLCNINNKMVSIYLYCLIPYLKHNTHITSLMVLMTYYMNNLTMYQSPLFNL